MTACSMPFVRRSGYFQVFFWTHLLYWLYVVLLILHAPVFWACIVVPLVVFALEKTYRSVSTLMGAGRTVVEEGVPMASRVTKLVIRRPINFNFSPGDWVFVRVPAVASSEWHPFTISSAPEVEETLTLHVRGVGQWTNRLYRHYEAESR